MPVEALALPSDYIADHADEFLADLSAFVAQPSISAQALGLNECAQLLAGFMTRIGIDARVLSNPAGAPVVYGEWRTDARAPTVLIYGHYDVQPPEPLDAWHSPPFEPSVRDGRLYGRGAGDNKGQLIAHLLALRSLQQLGRVPKINLKFLFEGEEEVSSRSLPGFVKDHRDLLKADLVYIADGPMSAQGPLVSFGGRGLLYIELVAQGATRDGHSGHWSGVLPSPAWELVQLLATLRRPDGRCTIEGFYDNVEPPTDLEREQLAVLPFDEAGFCKEWGLERTALPAGVLPYERLFQPSVNICGLTSGYGGEGSKTIIPARAVAKLDLRLVPNQHPERIWELVQAHVSRHAPQIKVRRFAATPPSKTRLDLPVSEAVVRAVTRAQGRAPLIYPLTGGTSPRHVFTDILGVPAITVPYANHDQQQHAPNENLRIADFLKGIQVSAEVFAELSKVGR